MKDNVNTEVRHGVEVRPFMVGALIRAEARLVEKEAENKPASWDDIDPDRLVAAAIRKSEDALGFTGAASHPAVSKQLLADAINYLGMAYDTVEQLEGSASA